MRPLIGILAILGACSEWPRVANVPKAEKLEKPGVDPGDLVDIDFASQDEAASAINDQPNDPDVPELALVHGVGQLIFGTLDGIGWADAAVAEVIEDDNCPGTTGTRSPLGTGDYIADVDFLVFDVAEKGTLCAQVIVDADSVGWDLTPRGVDPCRIPGDVLLDSKGEPVGIDLGGAAGGWSANVGPGPVAIGFAGYAPNDGNAQLTYAIAVSVVRERADGSEGVCPTHPEAAR